MCHVRWRKWRGTVVEEAEAEEADEVSEEVEEGEVVVSGLEPTLQVVEVEDIPADGNLYPLLTCSRDSFLYMTRNRLSSIRA
jgi:pyruvate-formate lyase-activating enzyme